MLLPNTTYNYSSEFNVTESTPKIIYKVNYDVSLRITFAIIAVLGIIGNSVVLFVVYRVKQMRTITNYFVAHQAFIDGISSILIVYHYLLPIVPIPSGIAGHTVCRLWAARYPLWSCLLASTYNLLALTVERYMAIVYPFRYIAFYTSGKRACLIFAFIWVMCLLFKSINIPRIESDDGECIRVIVYTAMENKIIAILSFLIEYFIPLFLMSFAYMHIIVVLNSKIIRIAPGMPNPPKDDHDSMNVARRNVVKTLLLVAMAFAVLWAPNQIYYFISSINTNIVPNKVFHNVTVIVAFCNCCVNPVIYALKYRQFRSGMKTAFGYRDSSNGMALTHTT
ncbi:galanin receptor 2a-like [Saccoglossus kowalevskii]|uniref:Substance-P receptor-like n=1 Tax=Saccoglossus kowalevskii TaxID=10224 RepID=A0ABM0MBC8_SACKO|nr:PREDICTED: substance-P receptor-like [Saccoglossus kowalevskii]